MSLSDQQWLVARAQVSVLQARRLRIKGKEGAYALLQVGAQKFSSARGQQRADPQWEGQQAAFELAGFPESGATLRVQVLQRALVGPDKVLGLADIDLGELYTDKSREKPQWFKLLGKPGKPEKDRGEIQLDIQFLKGSMSASMFDLSGPDKSRSKIGKLKDKLRGKKKEGLSDSASAIVPSVTQILTDSEGEEGEEPVSPEKKKKNKLKSLFAPKSNLHRNMSQSMSTLGSFPERDSAIASSTSSGLNVESPEGKKKFKFLTHKRTGSTDSKSSQSGVHSKQGAPPQLCINGSHVYREEPEDRGSTISLTSSGHGSMEELRREREEREEEERKRKVREEEEEQRQKIEEEKERMRLDREKELRRKTEEEQKQKEREAEEQRKLEEQKERMRLERQEEEQERKRKEREAEEQRWKFEEEKERVRLEREEEERRRKTEEERLRKEREAKEQKRKIEEEQERMRRKIEEEQQRKEREAEELKRKIEEERQRKEREAEELKRKIEEERQRKEREAEELKRKIEEERQRKEREAEELNRKIEEERQRKEREAEELKRKIEEERQRKEREEEEQRQKIFEEQRQRKEREAEEQRRKTEEEEKARHIAEEKRKRMEEEERVRKEEEKKREEAVKLTEERKAKEEEERRRKRIAEEEEAEIRKRVEEKRIREEEGRKEKERLRLEEERKNVEMERRKKEKGAEQEPRPVPKARTGKVSSASKPQEETLSEAASFTNPFEQSSSEEPPSTNPFEEPASPQPPASVRSARVSAMKPSASVTRTISQPPMVYTNPFLDDDGDSVDVSLENLSSNERSMERMAKKGRAPLPPQNKPEMIAPSKDVLLEEDKKDSPFTEVSKRQAPQPPGRLKKTSEEPDKKSQCTATPEKERKPFEGPERHQSQDQERKFLEGPQRPQYHGQERSPIEGIERPQSNKVALISKDELKAWCIQSMKLGKGQNSSPQKADSNHNQAAINQSNAYSGQTAYDSQISQIQSSKNPADTNPFTCGGPVPARHNKGPAPAKPLTTSTSGQRLSEDELSNSCSTHTKDKATVSLISDSQDNSSTLKITEGPKTLLDEDSKHAELALHASELPNKVTATEPLQTICLDNLPRKEQVEEHQNKPEPKSLQSSALPSVSQDVVCQESLVSKSDGLPNLDSLSQESEALAGTGAKKKPQAPLPPEAPLPPAKPKRVGDTFSPNQMSSVSASTSKVALGHLSDSQSNKNVPAPNQPKDTAFTTTLSSMASSVIFTSASEKKVGVSMSADSGSGSGSRSLPLARVVPTDVQNSAGDLKGAVGASASVIRSHAVKPLSTAADQQPDLTETNTSKATGGSDHMLSKPEAAEPVGKGPYSQLTRAELVSLVVRQQDQLSQRDLRIGELEQYIDKLLVRVMEEQPSILMSLSSKKKAV